MDFAYLSHALDAKSSWRLCWLWCMIVLYWEILLLEQSMFFIVSENSEICLTGYIVYTFSDYLFKLLLIGDSGVGKSCLLLRFAVSYLWTCSGGNINKKSRDLDAFFNGLNTLWEFVILPQTLNCTFVHHNCDSKVWVLSWTSHYWCKKAAKYFAWMFINVRPDCL